MLKEMDNELELGRKESDHESDDGSSQEHDLDAMKEQAEVIANRETRIVRGLRVLVILVLMVSTVVLAVAVHRYLDNSEQDEFAETFASDADKVLASIGSSIDSTLGAIDTLALSVVSDARQTEQKWPFVTIPDWYDWGNYTATHNSWVNETVRLQEEDQDFFGPIYHEIETLDYIHDYWGESVPERDYYLPEWQTSPLITEWAPYNWDFLSWSTTIAFDKMKVTNKPIITEAWLLPDPDDEFEMAEHNETIKWIAQYIEPGQDPDQPIFEVLYPLLDTVEQVRISDPLDQTLGGIFATGIYWRQMLENTLPSTSRGIVLVFENPCNPTFTFQINGEDVVYIGRGDFHDDDYNGMEVSAELYSLSGISAGDVYYSGLPIDEEFCPYTLCVFPSKLKEDDHTSNQPVVFPIAVAAIFVFTSLVFVFYDIMVEMRQRRVLSSAATSSAIVSSLFPKNIRERLYQEAKKKEKEGKKRQEKQGGVLGNMGPAGHSLSASLANFEEHESAITHQFGRPMADLFHETTIFFADLVGFTKWSSTRSPEDVFFLLESIYGAMDTIAEHRRVFKVETIGDCYVAATGLPEPQKDHSLIMVRFARDCLFKIDQLTNELAAQLGDGTNQLQMRVGLHSGPTTAGVLRGVRGRFQLFGDTVNVAARMESNGVPGRIHISEQTGNELSRHGKSNWFTPRTDKIQAKGKGELQTFFVTVVGAGSATTRNNPKGDSTEGFSEYSPEYGPGLETLEEKRENYPGDTDGVQLERQLADYMEKQDRGSQNSQKLGSMEG